jgi:hypothetical protein
MNLPLLYTVGPFGGGGRPILLVQKNFLLLIAAYEDML